MEAQERGGVATEALEAPEQAAAAAAGEAAAAAPLVAQPQAGEVVAGGAQQEALDPTMVATHSYLGEVDDLEGSAGMLEEGVVYNLPVLPLDGLVLCPGNTLPLRLTFRGDRALVQQALSAPPPLSRLIAVVCCTRSYFTPQLMLQRVGCVAEIRKMGGGGINLLAKGRQRVEVQLEAVVEGSLSLSSVPVRVLPEPPPLAVPPEAAAGLAWHPRALYAKYDAWQLARRAKRLFQSIAPQARGFEGNPLELSYFLLSNLPVDDDVRQQLLEAKTVDERLRKECKLLQALGALCCRACGRVLARSADAVQMSEEGISACYVNSHSFVHDIVTLSQVAEGVILEGSPETQHSWFPGYAWQCAYCSCQQHIGWRFTAVRSCLRPASFWGLRRPALQAGGDREGMGPGGGMFLHQGSSEEDGDGGWTSGEDEESLEDGGSEEEGGLEGSPLSSGSLPSSGSEEGGSGDEAAQDD
ncbi:cereblon isoform X2 isoform B [Chlorella sorokiniana]|uniref:Protein cereblon n=1 Tax=Chlorella sorokiniana TaxID=3076 RepID=A0A2P6TWW3_CHLSO|nr:cereblon isoform X2 isoform B [Chlorella sorokiniana]|eukprot:PRW58559.1 cereblon isoform X2 isoform B [Chlorella sorokiniana]